MSRILIIDDEEDVRLALRVVLEKDGHDVVEAEEGGAALRLLSSGVYDLVVIDLVMPGREGIETIQSIRTLKPDLPIFAISGAASVSLEMAHVLGALLTFKKPFDLHAFARAVNDATRRRPAA